MSQSDPKVVAAASVFSCAIYLTPLVGPHAGFFLGEVIWSEVSDALGGSGDHGLAWIATDAGVALLAQLALFLPAYWFTRTIERQITLIGTAPVRPLTNR